MVEIWRETRVAVTETATYNTILLHTGISYYCKKFYSGCRRTSFKANILEICRSKKCFDLFFGENRELTKVLEYPKIKTEQPPNSANRGQCYEATQ
jgi:hypothetical protein